MDDTPKRIERLVREYVGIAHDRELGQALLDLRTEFDRWQHGEISVVQVNDAVHQFHQGRSRDIWRKYATNHGQPGLACAVATGILRRDELPPELLQHLAGWIECYEAEQRTS